jgi:glycine betaine/choline ABC-type transport system substrate-binding protein
MYDLRTAPPDIVKVAVSDEGVRTTEEQQVYLATQKPRPVAKKQENDSEEDIQEPLSHQVVVRLTASEMEALRIRAALNHTTERGIARRFLLSSGALRRPDVKGARA